MNKPIINNMAAVEWLQEKYNSRQVYEESIFDEEFEQAKEMEKQQMIDFAKKWEERQNDGNLDTIEMLYEQTYNK
jgi:hypothetical protein